MKYFLDTEFYEDGKTIELISIAIVSEDGRELYLENSEFSQQSVPSGHWLYANIFPYLSKKPQVMATRAEIKRRVEEFVLDGSPEKNSFWGHFADYDWVVLCQLFGRMVDLPEKFPKFCMDLKQLQVMANLDSEWKKRTCPDPVDEHHALADAKWNRDLYIALVSEINFSDNGPWPSEEPTRAGQ